VVSPVVSYDDFRKLDIRVGTIVAVEDFPEARRPAFRLQVDFGAPIGVRRSSAQLVANYGKDALLGRQVAAVVNFTPKQIGKYMSEVLVLGFPDAAGEVRLIVPDGPVPNGGRLY
jgi:tRNA-binding protein